MWGGGIVMPVIASCGREKAFFIKKRSRKGRELRLPGTAGEWKGQNHACLPAEDDADTAGAVELVSMEKDGIAMQGKFRQWDVEGPYVCRRISFDMIRRSSRTCAHIR